tara:strand:- start:110 stop:358 length:249 start_codon:yes stop_codon:yes gene_type:complete
MMKNKKGIIFGIVPLLYMGLAIVVLGLLIWFGFRINEGLQAVFGFLKQWWWAVGIAIFGLLWNKQLTAIINKVLGYFGIKVR